VKVMAALRWCGGLEVTAFVGKCAARQRRRQASLDVARSTATRGPALPALPDAADALKRKVTPDFWSGRSAHGWPQGHVP